jgi:hypothetical protein
MSATFRPFAWPLVALALFAGVCANASADKKTACTITVNSADEKEAFRRSLPKGQWEFVELVERGRHDWLESACRTGVRCDVLIISGHYDGGNEFFSDQIEAREFLPVDEMERVSCSDSCPGLFSQLKEVYLFGCNTLNPQANASPSAEIGRSLVRAGFSRGDAERMTKSLAVRHAESSKDRMRLVFKDVPAIYGFSSVAPLGPIAGSILSRHLQASGTSEVGSGRVSGRLLGQFSAHAMAVTTGLTDRDPLAAHRRDVCQFADDRLAPERKLAFVHELLKRETAEARMFLPRLERLAASLDDGELESPPIAAAMSAIAQDGTARSRYLDLARDADSAAVRARMVSLATKFGWLSPDDERAELVRMFNEQLASTAITPAEVDLACMLNKDGEFLPERDRLKVSPALAERVSHAAILACLGSPEGRERVLRALTSPTQDDVKFAQVYLRHRPLDDRQELRSVMAEIARMNGGEAQVRALHALSQHRLSDPESLTTLARLYPVADSVGVQTAIAGILLRSEYRTIASPELVHTLRTRRLGNASGQDAIDVLIRRMQSQ